MKIIVDAELCEANGVCVGMAPDIFDLADDDALHIADDGIADGRRRELLEITGSCPRGALSLIEE